MLHRFNLSSPLIKLATLITVLFSIPLSAKITIDGVLDETEWKQAQRFEDFLITAPFSLKKPNQSTVALLLTNEKGIFVAFINQQSMDNRFRRKSERDSLESSDRNYFGIDFDGKAIMGYTFAMSLGGSKIDLIISNENQLDTDWDGDWEAATSETQTHWYSEIFLPWSVVPMTYQEQKTRTIGVVFSREIVSEAMLVSFPGVYYRRDKFLSLFHPVTVDQYESTKFDVFPYAVGSYDNLQDSSEYQAGMDLFWSLGSGQELNITVNPDFGQVESDQVVINFSPVEVLFSDKRPFFAENQGLFNISESASHSKDYVLMNTRRIGSSPDYNCD